MYHFFKFIVLLVLNNITIGYKHLRELAKKEGYKTYINGFHGHITVTSQDNNIIISTEKSPKEICKEVK